MCTSNSHPKGGRASVKKWAGQSALTFLCCVNLQSYFSLMSASSMLGSGMAFGPIAGLVHLPSPLPLLLGRATGAVCPACLPGADGDCLKRCFTFLVTRAFSPSSNVEQCISVIISPGKYIEIKEKCVGFHN